MSDMLESSEKVTAAMMRDSIRQHFSRSEWVLAFEVGNATGFECRGWADAIAMNVWPSRGLAVHGIEIKVSRQDLKRELERPEKAENLSRFCDYWWLAVPPGVIGTHDLPAGWGVFERQDGGLKMRRQAAKADRGKSLDRGFAAALFRSVHASDSAEIETAARKRADELVRCRRTDWENDRKRELSAAQMKADKLREVLSDGDPEWIWLGDEEICRAVSFVFKSGITKSRAGASAVLSSLASANDMILRVADEIRAAAEAHDIPINGRTEFQRAVDRISKKKRKAA